MEIDDKLNNIDKKCVKIEQSVKVADNKMSTKLCNKFSIESILGLNRHSQSNDFTKSNQLELIDLCRKGNVTY